MKKNALKALATILIVALGQSVNAQVISSETIKSDVKAFLTDSTSADYWLTVQSIFEANESRLVDHQYYLLYYGQSAKPEQLYPGMVLNMDRIKLRNMVETKRYRKAVHLGEKLIKVNPLDVPTLIYLSMSIDM